MIQALPSGPTLDSCERRIGPRAVVSADPNVDVSSIAITIIFACCVAIRLSWLLASTHRESVATRTRTAWNCKQNKLLSRKRP